MEGYEELYDKIQETTNEMNNFFGMAKFNGVEMDDHTKELVEKMENLSRELSETSHELEEHLAWDKKESPLSGKEIIDSKILIGIGISVFLLVTTSGYQRSNPVVSLLGTQTMVIYLLHSFVTGPLNSVFNLVLPEGGYVIRLLLQTLILFGFPLLFRVPPKQDG